MQFFEFKRALGHAWYLHTALCLYSFFFSSGQLIYHLLKDAKKDDGKVIHWKDIIMYLLATQVLVCLSLFVLAIVYPRDTPFSNRDFIRGPNAEV